MWEYLELKSKADSIYDYSKVDITGFIPEFTPDPVRLEKDLQRYLNRYGTKEECEDAQEGDLVVLSCRSGDPKFCKDQITVPLGKGMFSRKLEEQLFGMRRGEEKTVDVDGTEVAVSIQKITRTHLPKLTDETVRSWGMEGVDTVADLKRECVNRQIDRFLDEDESADSASAYMWQEVGKKSRFALDPEEYAKACEYAEDKLRERAQPGEDEMEEEEAAPKPEDMEVFLRDIFINELRMAAIGCQMCREAGTLLKVEDYEIYLKKWMDAEPSLSEEEARRRHPLDRFMIENYCDVIARSIDGYVAECFKKAMNP